MARTGRPMKEPKEVRRKSLPVISVTDDEDAELRAGAEKDGMKLAAWFRWLGLKRRARQKKT